MKNNPSLCILRIPILLIILPSLFLHTCSSQDPQFVQCKKPYICKEAEIKVGFPFWGNGRPNFCGLQGFELNCSSDISYHAVSVISISNHKFVVRNILETSQTMTVTLADFWDRENKSCPTESMNNFSLDYSHFYYVPSTRNISLFSDCDFEYPYVPPYNYSCGDKVFYGDERNPRGVCRIMFRMPVHEVALTMIRRGWHLGEALRLGFELGYITDRYSCSNCVGWGGVCGSNSSNLDTQVCICPYGARPFYCEETKSKLKTIAIVSSSTAFGLLVTVMVIIYFCSRIRMRFWEKESSNQQKIEAFIESFGSLGPRRFSYSDIKKMTNSFQDKLGQGGYGGVYKGKLLDGRLVAVKLLSSSKGNGEDFINEVASISKTSHVNVVALLGFCFQHNKKALVYEFMPNGSLDKLISDVQQLGLEKLSEIAIGIARGLEYLHRGCSTRILHLDIKPHNILLDEDFTPKIADFGLAKLCRRKESKISMSEARGTIGYIAPEVFCRNFGNVSHKSDVYSYGMMILEMVGGRNKCDIEVSDCSEMYFPQYLYNQLKQDENLGMMQGILTREQIEITRKMIIVGLSCIQTDPSQRPSMNKVLEMLEGSIETLQVPPRPFLSSPPCPSRIPTDTTSLLETSK